MEPRSKRSYEEHRHAVKNKHTGSYKSWANMKNRCTNKNYKWFHRYGGRGIIVCDEWKNSYVSFYRDMGDRPENMTLDRIDNDGNYEPSNCRWATRQQQQEHKLRRGRYSSPV